MNIKATWGNIELTEKARSVNSHLETWETCGWLPEQLVEHGLACITQPVFIDGAEYILHFIGHNGLNEKAVYWKGLNEFNGETGSSYPASYFGTKFTVELVTMGPAPEVPPVKPDSPLYDRIVKALGDRKVPVAGESHLVGQVVVDHQKAILLDKVIEEFNIPTGGDVIKWLHNRTGTVEKAARQFVLNSFEYQGPNYDISLMNKAFNELAGVLGIECKYDNPNPDSIKSLVPGRQHPRNKYDREILPGVHVDVYDVLAAFTTNSAAIDHAVKKLLAPGQRGVKDRVTDLKEAVSSIQREIDRIGEWSDRAAGGQIASGKLYMTGEHGLTTEKLYTCINAKRFKPSHEGDDQ